MTFWEMGGHCLELGIREGFFQLPKAWCLRVDLKLQLIGHVRFFGGLYELMNKLSQTNKVNGKILIRIFLLKKFFVICFRN